MAGQQKHLDRDDDEEYGDSNCEKQCQYSQVITETPPSPELHTWLTLLCRMAWQCDRTCFQSLQYHVFSAIQLKYCHQSGASIPFPENEVKNAIKQAAFVSLCLVIFLFLQRPILPKSPNHSIYHYIYLSHTVTGEASLQLCQGKQPVCSLKHGGWIRRWPY